MKDVEMICDEGLLEDVLCYKAVTQAYPFLSKRTIHYRAGCCSGVFYFFWPLTLISTDGILSPFP